MVFTVEMWIIFAVSLLLCCMGFYRFVWFMSVGYGLSTAGIGAAVLILSLVKGPVNVIWVLECLIMIAYGIRLGGFLFFRELKNAAYRAKAHQVGGDARVPVFVAVIMWISCAALYLCQTAGIIYRHVNNAAAGMDAALVIGTVISLLGVILESWADAQKNAQKKLHPDLPAMEGLYRLCRCPNYFGEMLFWTGVFITGISIYTGFQWAVAVFGWVCICGIMVSGAKRVETRHIKNYGSKAVYNKYADTVPLLIPFVPLYHMTNPDRIAREEAAKKAKAAAKKAK